MASHHMLIHAGLPLPNIPYTTQHLIFLPIHTLSGFKNLPLKGISLAFLNILKMFLSIIQFNSVQQTFVEFSLISILLYSLHEGIQR